MVVDKIRETIERERLIQKNDKILVALSGGPDSVCLLHSLKTLESEYNIKIYAAHLNHKIRGIEAQKDSIYAAQLCDSLGIVCFMKAVDVPAIAKENKKGIEETARNERYSMLFEVMNKIGANKLAVAHNLDDQAETVLMRLMRGTGMAGLKGMDYKRQDGLIRPLMDVKKIDIEHYCEINNLKPRIDATNLEPDYTRNKIRLKLIPFIEDEFNPNFKESIARMANIMRQDHNYMESQVESFFEKNKLSSIEGKLTLEVEEINELHESMKSLVIRKAIEKVVGNTIGIENIHIEDVLKLVREGKSKNRIDLPKGLKVYRNTNSIILTLEEIVEENNSFEHILQREGYKEIQDINLSIDIKIMDKDECSKYPTGPYSKAFDLDKIKGNLILRTRKNGDRMSLLGMNGTKKLKDIMIDLKIPREERDKIPVLTDDNGIIWIVGHKMSKEYKIDETTKSVIRISVKPL